MRNAPRRKRLRAVAAAVLGPALATVVALGVGRIGAVGAAALYLATIVAASAIGGVAGGVGASALSFLGLNYFFAAPRHTFRVTNLDDLVALIVFSFVAAVVGTLFARALDERARAERREKEALLLNGFSTRLLSGHAIESVLEDLARGLLDLLGLSRCEIEAELPGKPVRVGAGGDGDGLHVTTPLSVGSVRLGELRIVRRAAAPDLSGDERAILLALADQIALALERERLGASVREARVEAEVSQMRAALFSSVTHDLRTPLASIKAGVTSLLDDEVSYEPEQRRELLGGMLQETERLNRLVRNLLHLARARAGALEPEKELVPFEDVVESVLTRMRAHLAAFRLRAMIRPDLPAIWIDPVQIDQVLTNVLENATRYSPPGGEIGIAVTSWRDGVQIRVTDQGPGIPVAERERVFEAFYRVKSDQRDGGTGLGLAIARAIVSAHGGRIWAEGTPAGGAAIVIELPRGAQSETGG